MNKVILMSIQSKWLVKILNGEKTMEIRRSVPDCKLPIDVYLYCTKSKPYIPQQSRSKFTKLMNGKVVAKFTLNSVDEYEHLDNGYDLSKFVCSKTNDMVFDDYKPTQFELKSCLEYDDIVTYAWNKKYGKLRKINNIYAWHIENLVIFDKPKDLWDFHTRHDMLFLGMAMARKVFQFESVYKAPQSWQYAYVKEKENVKRKIRTPH